MQAQHSLARQLRARPFGKKGAATPAAAGRSSLTEDIKLFALTFAGGFLFMTVFLA